MEMVIDTFYRNITFGTKAMQGLKGKRARLRFTADDTVALEKRFMRRGILKIPCGVTASNKKRKLLAALVNNENHRDFTETLSKLSA